jgi:chemotaxis protein MotB
MKMKLLFFCLSAVITLSGCVTKKMYQDTLSETEECRTKTESVYADLGKERSEAARLRAELETKDNEISALKALAEETALTRKDMENQAAEIARLKEALDAREKERESLSNEVEKLKAKSGEISSAKEQELQKVKGTYEALLREMKQEIDKGDIKITQALDRLSVNLVEKILFDSGEADLKPEGLKIIKRVGDILKGISDKQIRVEGHTDNVQIGAKIRDRYPSNWELSTARATNVVRYLQDKVRINSKQLSAAGFADSKPVATNKTPEGKAQNRRIEIVLLPLDVDSVLEGLKK